VPSQIYDLLTVDYLTEHVVRFICEVWALGVGSKRQARRESRDPGGCR
jgi:hypothetical protein